MKTQVYSWRLSPEKKLALEAEARREGKSVAEVLDEMSSRWLAEKRASAIDDDARQAKLRKRVLAAAGTIRGGDPTRSERARELVQAAIRERYEEERRDSRRAH